MKRSNPSNLNPSNQSIEKYDFKRNKEKVKHLVSMPAEHLGFIKSFLNGCDALAMKLASRILKQKLAKHLSSLPTDLLRIIVNALNQRDTAALRTTSKSFKSDTPLSHFKKIFFRENFQPTALERLRTEENSTFHPKQLTVRHHWLQEHFSTLSSTLTALDLNFPLIENNSTMSRVDLSTLPQLSTLTLSGDHTFQRILFSSTYLPSEGLLQVLNCPNLISLKLRSFEKLTHLDLSNLHNLKSLVVQDCKQLTTFNLSVRGNLTSLKLIGFDKLKSENIIQILNQCPNLSSLVIEACYDVEDLEFPDLTNLISLIIKSCKQLFTIKLSKLPNLTKLDIIDCYDLQEIINFNELEYPQPTNLTSLIIRECNDQQFEKLNLSGLTKLISLTLDGPWYLDEEFNLTQLTQLTHLDFKDAGPRDMDIDLSNHHNLTFLRIDGFENFPTLPKHPNLTHLDLNDCSVDTLNLTNYPHLSTLKIQNFENLGSLSITNCPKLKTLAISKCPKLNTYEGLEVTNLTSLIIDGSLLEIEENQRSSLLNLIENNQHLTYLELNNRNLVALNLTNHPHLSTLKIRHCNNLISVTITNLPDLKILNIPDSLNLEEITLTKCGNLACLDLYGSLKLTSQVMINILKECPKLFYLDLRCCALIPIKLRKEWGEYEPLVLLTRKFQNVLNEEANLVYSTWSNENNNDTPVEHLFAVSNPSYEPEPGNSFAGTQGTSMAIPDDLPAPSADDISPTPSINELIANTSNYNFDFLNDNQMGS